MPVRFALRNLAVGISLALGMGALPATALAAPTDTPLRIVVGFAPGGALDIFARALAEKLRVSLDTPVLVENRPGASARLALDNVRRSPPDGKTLLISPAPPFTIFPLTYKQLPYDPDKDLVPVAYLADVPLVASTSVSQPYRTMQEYLAWVKRDPSKGGVGLVTLGGSIHFGVVTLSKEIGVPLTPTAYRGVVMMLTDEIGGTLPIGIDAIAGQMELYRAGKIRFLGVTGTRRSSLLPDVPTLAEAGAPGFETASGWYSAFLPAGTPPATVARLEKALLEAVRARDIRDKMATLGMELNGQPATALRQTIQDQRARWRPVVMASGFTATE
ncbi:tripartite tricarboxylate transporter substrate binding protein [Cupriavidus sp. P-10]|uniref:tripartite tricarboxylate transporter substrate-binding protein n=1 Tax=Cupriavidus sp. P-10 TaxID=2027911 RepID=UPI000E2F82E2|nr:tripartite tricarboxylate transporter substrate-binding protein [Cupriavidus sp. P-10]BDB27003.1 tripartite tricarboxylate transporter substrate binding protein [Cupriavidus sp. P-10]